jgi:predicted transcriptional regulator
LKQRSRRETFAQILKSATDDRDTKTKIMYRCFLTYVRLNECLAILTENGLLEYDKAENKYKPTERGHHYLTLYDKLGNIVQKH